MPLIEPSSKVFSGVESSSELDESRVELQELKSESVSVKSLMLDLIAWVFFSPNIGY